MLKILLSLFILLALTSCKKSNDPPAAATNSGVYFSQCTVNNYACYDNASSGTSLESDSNGNPKYTFILGMYVDKNTLQQLTVLISLKSFSGKGKYTLTVSNTEVDYVVRPASDTYASKKVTGTLEITDYQPKKTITGKFAIVSSDGTRTIELKDGTFNVQADF